MHDGIKAYIHTCPKCSTQKPINTRIKLQPRPLPIATQAWHHIQLDFMPELPAVLIELLVIGITYVHVESRLQESVPCREERHMIGWQGP